MESKLVKLFYLLLLFLTFSCSKDENIIPEVSIPKGKVNYFSEPMDFTPSGGSKNLDFTSNVNWTLKVSETQGNVNWCKASQYQGEAGTFSLSIDVEENNSYGDRSAVLVLKADSIIKKIVINQKQNNAIILSSNIVEMAQEGGTFSVDVNSNVSFTIDIPSSCSSWVKKAKTSGTRSLSKTTCSFDVLDNEELEKREGEIYFRYNDLTDTLKICQSGGPILMLSPNEFNLEGDATTISVIVESNDEYNVTISDNWISEVSTRGVSVNFNQFKIASNKTGKNRTGKITFSTSDGQKKAEVTINQASIIEVQSLRINFINTSGTMGGKLYIDKDYQFYVTATPDNASADYEWKVEDTSIATISYNESLATLSTKDFGKTKIKVTDRITGISESYDFGTCVTDFQFAETSRDTKYGYPVIKMAVGDRHQLNYYCTPSYAKKVFSDLSAFNFNEIIGNTYLVVNKSSIVDIDKNGVMTAKKVGTTIIEANNSSGVYKSGSNDGVFVEVVKEISPYGSIGGHGYVDLGLPSGKLWATENFGAYSETDYGAYYLWTSNDRVPTSWGNKWSTPTIQEFDELLNNCSHKWTAKNGVNGYLFTGKNGAKLFLPAAGFKNYIEGYGYSDVTSGGNMLLYWSSTRSNEYWEGHGFACTLSGNSSSITTNATYNISVIAATIRPISR